MEGVMKNKWKLIVIVIIVLTLPVIGVAANYNVKKDIGFEEVFNNISYFSNYSPEDIQELNINGVYIFDSTKQWSTFEGKYLQGETLPAMDLQENEKIIFIHTKWEDLNWGNSYYVESMEIKDKTLNISIKENGKVEKVAGFPEDSWVHNILVCKVDGKNIKDSYGVDLIMGP
jgi:hypothetical protein